ncbi:metalloregulator ArsR/SmtB family transcription factor [Spirosoma sp. KNUC1025]|uniref:ArsR/SmtB family transcription factor n=1 Tax=Spirosoma sp. KNUC1025 TaxID=2894082 RepID=UPI00386B2426|nr:metalloregulator ArsR/SmtB family transcription factor [Spirosoma sp. KNUC1025]
MIDSKTDQVAEILKTIGHPNRMRIVLALAGQSHMRVATLQEQLQIEPSLLSHHLTKLKDTGILASKRQGKDINYSLLDAALPLALKALL